VLKSLETYDFLAIPSLNKKLVVELSRGEWIGRRENVLALGNSGTGKTHIGLAVFTSVSPLLLLWCTN
jgi:DNA replication protein DnaC